MEMQLDGFSLVKEIPETPRTLHSFNTGTVYL